MAKKILTPKISRSTVHTIVHQVTTIPLHKLLYGCYLASLTRHTSDLHRGWLGLACKTLQRIQ